MTEESAESVVDRRMALASEWDALVGQVRALKGFEDFLRPSRIETLLPASSAGPVVIVNVSRWRCDALIVRFNGVSVRPLPDLTLHEATQRAGDYLSALQAVDQAVAAYAQARVESDGGIAAARRTLQTAEDVESAVASVDQQLLDLQEWMWSTIADPVLDDLGFDRTPDGPTSSWPRLWWCPTGPLTMLPIHSAGYHGEPSGSRRRSVLDRVVSSYTPSLRALLNARTNRLASGSTSDVDEIEVTGDSAPEGRLLVVSLDETPGQPPLDGRQERAALQAVPAIQRTELAGKMATRTAVLDALPHHRWVHFSCHGDQDLTDPSHGGLVLYDDRLTIADISGSQFRGDFAGLSACKSAVGGIDLLDEAITLSAALHYTGYRHVVATLWSVDDEVSSTVFTSIYQRCVIQGQLQPDLAVFALHDALRELRDRPGVGARAWVPFTHTGP